MSEKRANLADALIYEAPLAYHDNLDVAQAFASSIIDRPQAHIDALVEAGVLEAWAPKNGVQPYAVVTAHVHEWRVGTTSVESRQPVAELWCRGCRERRTVPNRLPIEIPS